MSTLTIDVTTDAKAAAADIDALATSARTTGDAIDASGKQVTAAGGAYEKLGGHAETLDDRNAKLTGGLGALSSGFELVGLDQYAGGLQAAAMATDGLSGVGQLLSVVTESNTVKWITNTAAKAGNAVASAASTVATGAMTVAQGALNAVMSANPLALVVIALAALTAGVVLAYKHSETFRGIVDSAFGTAKRVVDDASDAVSHVLGWFRQIPDVVRLATLPARIEVGLVVDAVEEVSGAVGDVIGWFRNLPGEARAAWGAVTGAVTDAVSGGVDKVHDLTGAVSDGAHNIVGKVAASFTAMFKPILTAIQWVQDLIDKIGGIHLPHIDLPGFGRVDLPGLSGSTSSGGGSTMSVTIPVSIEGALDKDATARQLVDVLRRYFGRSPDFGGLTFG